MISIAEDIEVVYNKLCRVKSDLKKQISTYLPQIAVIAFALFFIIFYYWESIFITIHAGEAGVLYRRFRHGTVVDKIYTEGFYIVAPWNTMAVYSVRYQIQNHQMEVISETGLHLKISLAIRYRPDIEMLGLLHQEVGNDYLHKVVIPEIEAKYRELLGQYTLREIFEPNNSILRKTENESRAFVTYRFVEIDDVMLTNIELPLRIKSAIEEKLTEQQIAESYIFRLDKERSEAKRRKIEAEGIRNYSHIVESSLDEKVLRWRGLEATSELAKSSNEKIVIIGSEKGNIHILTGTNK